MIGSVRTVQLDTEVDVMKAMRTVEISVTVHRRREAKLRTWAGAWVIRFGAWIIGVGRCDVVDAEGRDSADR